MRSAFRTGSVMLCLSAALLGAQKPVRLVPGAPVRLVLWDSTNAGADWFGVAGRFNQLSNDTLLIDVGVGGLSRVPRRQVSSIAVAVGRQHPYVHDILFGTAIGFAVGGIFEIAAPCKHCDLIDAGERTLGGRFGSRRLGPIGGVAGAIVASIGRRKWVRVGIPQT